MKRLLATALLAATVAGPAIAADAKQELSITRGSTTDQVSGLVVQGNSVVLVYGAPGMGASNQAVRITPDGGRLRVVYDTVGNLGVNTSGLSPMMMIRGPSGGDFPIYNMPSSGSN
jgi:opacity protein-like surface antigen